MRGIGGHGSEGGCRDEQHGDEFFHTVEKNLGKQNALFFPNLQGPIGPVARISANGQRFTFF